MKETLILDADPDIPRTAPDAGKNVPARHSVYGNKPASIKVDNPSRRNDPNAPAIVQSDRVYCLIWQSTTGYLAHGAEDARPARRRKPAELLFSFGADAHGRCASLTINRNLAVIPSVQAINSAKPNASSLAARTEPTPDLEKLCL